MAIEQSTVVYREIPWDTRYRVGSDGSVWSRCRNRHGFASEWKQLKLSFLRYRTATYRQVDIGRRQKYKVHILMMLVFVGPVPAGMEVRHANGDGLDNRLSNLCYGTRAENEADKKLHGRDNTGERNGQAKLNPAKVREIRALRCQGATQQKIANMFGVDRGTVRAILDRKIWRHIV